MGYPKVGDEYSGRYRIVRLIGHGGMGAVYEALDTVLDRPVALKVVLPSLTVQEDFHARFAREASVLARIRSRNIVGIHEYGQHDDTVYFVTELFRDGDLRRRLTEHGPLDRRAALVLLAQVCEALADAHAAGVIHRDVKPANVLLWQRPEGLVPYLCDFGIALDGTAEREGLTRTGTLVGSPAYMAPERHFGHPADERGDVYSAGCVLWAALTGDAPYSGTDFQTINAHINSPVPQLATGDPLDDRIDAVLAAALHKDPDRRVATAADLRAALLEVVRGIDAGALAGSAAPVVPPVPASRVAAVPPPGGSDTAVRRVAADPSGPHLPQAPGVPLRHRGRPARRGAAALVGVAAAVALVAGGTAAVVATRDADRGGQPLAAASTTAAGTAAQQVTTGPAAPPAPRVQVAPGYRSVVFRVRPPHTATLGALAAPVEHRVERRVVGGAAAGWRSTGRAIRLPTRQGGDRACLRLRTVAVDASGAEVPGPAVRRCGTARARTVRLVHIDGPCSGVENGYTYPCRWYGVAVAGFAAGAAPLARLRRAGTEQWCADFDCRPVQVGDDGRGTIQQYFRIYRDSGLWEVDVDGVQHRLELTYE